MLGITFGWFFAFFFGLVQLGVAAEMIFWSHFWSPHPIRELGGFYKAFYERRLRTESALMQGGHFFNFLFAWIFSSAGFLFVIGGTVAALQGSTFGALVGQFWVFGPAIGAGFLFTVIGMSLKTGDQASTPTNP